MVHEPEPQAFRLRTTAGSSQPIYKQIVNQVRAAIASRQLRSGDSLPSVRAVAEDLVVNANTVAKAYGELVRSGDVVSEPGKGVFVSKHRPTIANEERQRRLQAAVAHLLAEVIAIGANPSEVLEAVRQGCESVGLQAMPSNAIQERE